METLAWPWACDLRGRRHVPLPAWESQIVCNVPPPGPPSGPPPGPPPLPLMWTEQLSPHLQRNKQLQEALQQREEELARLQEENQALREFLASSFVRNLEQKAKKLTADGKLKRPLPTPRGTVCRPLQVSKRVCRNLAAELGSASSCSEPNLDLWVLQTLGLKDRDTIDTSGSSSESGHAAPSSSPGYGLGSPSGSPVATPTACSAHSCCQTATPEPAFRFAAARRREANCDTPANACPSPAGGLTAIGASGPYTATVRAYTASPAPYQDPPETCSGSSGGAGYWSPLQSRRTPSQDLFLLSPPAERVHLSPRPSSTPTSNQVRLPAASCCPPLAASCCPPPAASCCLPPPAATRTPHCQGELAFSMSLSPSSSVRTHSFPQGQAFTRRNTEGRWNFTWVPKQGP